tara:strand:+ start:1471 stop:1692 length:222 start_codon:yes stop_codon:yes gene_type:complete
MTHLLPSKSSTLKQKRLIKKYRDRSLRLLEKINPSEKRGVYHQSEPYSGLGNGINDDNASLTNGAFHIESDIR